MFSATKSIHLTLSFLNLKLYLLDNHTEIGLAQSRFVDFADDDISLGYGHTLRCLPVLKVITKSTKKKSQEKSVV